MKTDCKEVTIYDIARKLDISTATVSRGLRDNPLINKRTRVQIHAMAESLGYRTNIAARNLRSQRTYNIGVMIPDFTDGMMPTAFSHIESIANQAGLGVLVKQSFKSVETEIANASTLFENRVDGLLVSAISQANKMQHFERFMNKGIPVVFFDQVPKSDKYAKISIDERKVSRDATMRLLERGCKRIVFVTLKSGANFYAQRLQGYVEALAMAEIQYDENLIVYKSATNTSEAELVTAIKGMKPLPDGVFIAADRHASSCIMALEKANIHKRLKIAIIEQSNSISEAVEPNLSIIKYPSSAMGEAAIRMLLKRLNEDIALPEKETILLCSKLIVCDPTSRYFTE